jgi:predicted regulator of Ras-like GTPase activity (Roadblock/LC7/MglB family)
LLAMNDGLVVASQLPKPLNGETVAAFLPQIFGRLTQFAGELKLGDLSSVMLVMDNSPWIIFRTGKVYFAVVGKAGEALPLPQLTAIVADIKRQNL